MYFISLFVGIATWIFWPTFFLGALILHARTQSAPTLLLLSGAVAACLGALIQFSSQFPVVFGLIGAGGPPIGILLRAIGYILFAGSFIWYARSQPKLQAAKK